MICPRPRQSLEYARIGLLWTACAFLFSLVFLAEWIAGRLTGKAVYELPWPRISAGLLAGLIFFLTLCRGHSFGRLWHAVSSLWRPLAVFLCLTSVALILSRNQLGYPSLLDPEYGGAAPSPWRAILYITGHALVITFYGTSLYLLIRDRKQLVWRDQILRPGRD